MKKTHNRLTERLFREVWVQLVILMIVDYCKNVFDWFLDSYPISIFKKRSSFRATKFLRMHAWWATKDFYIVWALSNIFCPNSSESVQMPTETKPTPIKCQDWQLLLLDCYLQSVRMETLSSFIRCVYKTGSPSAHPVKPLMLCKWMQTSVCEHVCAGPSVMWSQVQWACVNTLKAPLDVRLSQVLIVFVCQSPADRWDMMGGECLGWTQELNIDNGENEKVVVMQERCVF